MINPKFFRWILVVLSIYTVMRLLYSVFHYNPFVSPASGYDFRVVLQGISLWKDTGNILRVNEQTTGVYHGILYYLLLRPFSGMEVKAVELFLYFLQFPLFFWATLWLVRAVSIQKPTAIEYALSAILVVNFSPFLETLSKYKAESLLYALLCLAFYLFRKQKDGWAGMVIAVGAALKWFPGILVAYFLLRRERKVLLGIFSSFIVILIFLFASVEGHAVWQMTFLHPIQLLMDPEIPFNRIGVTTEWQTLRSAIFRLFSETQTSGSNFERQLQVGNFSVSHPTLALWAALFLQVLLGAAYVVFMTRRGKFSRQQRDMKWPFYLLEISLSLLMLAIVTNGFRYHYAVLFLPAYVSVGILLYQYRLRFLWIEKTLFVLSYALSSMPIPGGILNRLPANPWWGKAYTYFYLWASLPVYGYLLLGLCILICYKRISTEEWIWEKG